LWESGGIAPCILNLGTSGRRVTGLDVKWSRGPLFYYYYNIKMEFKEIG
jgi:hypothetical protein